MNSFNTIANMMNGVRWDAGNISIDPFLLFYKVHYHCLANFWVIPMKHGRKSTKSVGGMKNYDSPILYIHELMKESYEGVERELEIKSFKQIHFLPETDNPEKVRAVYEQKDGKEALRIACDYIDARARTIVNNGEMTDKLYDYFVESKLIDAN